LFGFCFCTHATQPVTEDDWKSDTLITINVGDVLREIIQSTTDVVVAMKVFNYGPHIAPSANKPTNRKRKVIDDQGGSDDNSQSSEGTSGEESEMGKEER
jgi:hypothetical protein